MKDKTMLIYLQSLIKIPYLPEQKFFTYSNKQMNELKIVLIKENTTSG